MKAFRLAFLFFKALPLLFLVVLSAPPVYAQGTVIYNNGFASSPDSTFPISDATGATFCSTGDICRAEAFTVEATGILEEVHFKICNTVNATGNAFVAIRAVTGTVGTSAVPTGPDLALSDAEDVSLIPIVCPTNTATIFTFSGVNRITLTVGLNFAAVIGTLSTGAVSVGRETVDAPPADQNSASCNPCEDPWAANNTYFFVFQVLGDSPPEVTATALNCVPSSVDRGSGTTCTATVTGATTTPTGTVTFSSDGTGSFTPATTCALSETTPPAAACSVTYTPTVVGDGTHTLTADYGGDATHLASSDTFDLGVDATTSDNFTSAARAASTLMIIALVVIMGTMLVVASRGQLDPAVAKAGMIMVIILIIALSLTLGLIAALGD